MQVIDLRQHDPTPECYERHKKLARFRCRGPPPSRRAETEAAWEPGNSSACPSLRALPFFHAGWNGSLPCRCDSSTSFSVNCEGIPS
eukprot:849855-Prymnesium_polylepis.3